MDPADFASAYSPAAIRAVAEPIFAGNAPPWQRHPFSHPVLKGWLDSAAAITTAATPDKLLGLAPQTKRGLATALLCRCQDAMGLSVDDLTLKPDTAEDYEGYLATLRRRMAASGAGSGAERLVAAFTLAEKAMLALGRSEPYTALIEESAQTAARTVARNRADFADLGLNEHGNHVYGFIVAGMQADVWQTAAPAVFAELPDFGVFAAPGDWQPNRYFQDEDGRGYFFIDPAGEWARCPEKMGWLVAHEHLHHVQRHMQRQLATGRLPAGQDFYEDTRNTTFADAYGVKIIGNAFLPGDGNTAPGIDVWIAAQKLLYRAHPDEHAAFALHTRIQTLLAAEAANPPVPVRPSLGNPKAAGRPTAG